MKSKNDGEMLESVSLVIFVRFPHLGEVKSRLAVALGEEKAANFYRLCAEHVFKESDRVLDRVQRYIFYSDRSDESETRQWVGPQFNILSQIEGDLGRRLEHAFRYLFSRGTHKAIILASDVPDISVEIINDAISALDHDNIVIGPSVDGGYYLLGMKKLHKELFKGISWSTEKVLKQTLSVAEKLRLTVCSLPELRDIDTEEDLREWMKTAADNTNPILIYTNSVLLL